MLVQADAAHLPFRDNSVDITAAIEVIEHLTKENGRKMLKELERVAKSTVFLTTPNGFTHKHAEQEQHATHKSGWKAKDFKQRGYKVRGYGFRPKKWRKTRIIGKILNFLDWIFTPLSWKIPQLGYGLI